MSVMPWTVQTDRACGGLDNHSTGRVAHGLGQAPAAQSRRQVPPAIGPAKLSAATKQMNRYDDRYYHHMLVDLLPIAALKKKLGKQSPGVSSEQ